MDSSIDSIASLVTAIESRLRTDYVYMYPPRQAYSPLELSVGEVSERLLTSCRARDRLNIYVHVPFCRQLCGFCNLFTTTIRSETIQRRYVDSVRAQIDALAELVPGTLSIPTIYVGGGTPTVLPLELLRSMLSHVRGAWQNVEANAEIAIEVDPQTVDREALEGIRDAGFNRVNLGLQTRAPDELVTIGRRYSPSDQASRVADAMAVGFTNVCVDLIFGLPGQSLATWQRSVRECIDLRPHTICCYPLTHRPHTGFARRGVSASGETYEMWSVANELLMSAGFARQSHVRWARDGGGYLQKELHWGLDNVLGIGAGARSYLWELDLRSGYSILDRNSAVDAFVQGVESGEALPHEGFVMDAEERARKAVILGLLDLDLDRFEALLGERLEERFSVEFGELEELGLIERTPSRIRLVEAAVPFRDLVAQLFFSERVRSMLRRFTYAE
jgi:oxygen-independent coproporphyrinogen-3 oxidase